MRELKHEPLDLIITGVGGQGNVLASQVLGRALLNQGYSVTVGETYGLSQRGGAVMSMVRATREKVMGPLVPAHRASAVLGLEPLETLRVLGQYGHPEVLVMTNDRPLYPINVIAGENAYPDLAELQETLRELSGEFHWLPATDVALELGAPILANVVLLGALSASGILPLSAEEIIAALEEMFPEEKMPVNRLALERGRALLGG